MLSSKKFLEDAASIKNEQLEETMETRKKKQTLTKDIQRELTVKGKRTS